MSHRPVTLLESLRESQKVWCLRRNETDGNYKYGIPVTPCTNCLDSAACKLVSEYPNDPRVTK